jgi:hypothetical protein
MYVGMKSNIFIIGVSIYMMWICSFIYHMYLSIGDIKTAKLWYYGDISGQLVSLGMIAFYSPCISLPYKALILFSASFGVATCEKTICIAVHILLNILSWLHGCGCGKATLYLAASGIAYLIDEIGGVPFVWGLGHLFCAAYTYYTLLAHGYAKI